RCVGNVPDALETICKQNSRNYGRASVICGWMRLVFAQFFCRERCRMRRFVVLSLVAVACSPSSSDVANQSGAVMGSPADPSPVLTFTQNALAVGINRTPEPASASSCSFGSGTTNPYGTWFADFNGDGHLDVFDMNHGQACHVGGLWINNATGGFGQNIYSVATQVAPSNGNYSLTNEVAFVGDLTGDGRPDLYFISWSGLGGMC